MNPAERRDARRRNFVVYIEVIDPAGARVLASRGPISAHTLESEFYDFFPRTNLAYRRTETPDGYTVVQLLRTRLVAQ